MSRTGLCVLALMLCLGAPAATVSYTGAFQQDDNMALIGFTLSTPGDVVIRTWSYAGGTNADGTVIPRGGFDPVISVFDPSQLLIAVNDNGDAQVSADLPSPPGTGFRWDSYLQLPSLAAGSYLLVLTEADNLPLGPTYSDGFVRQGQGNFTGGMVGMPGGSFLDASGSQRTGQWAVDLSGVDAPEPGTAGVFAIGATVFLGLGWFRKGQKERSKSR